MDRITLRGIRVQGRHGAEATEREHLSRSISRLWRRSIYAMRNRATIFPTPWIMPHCMRV
jgi:hypothetical protein